MLIFAIAFHFRLYLLQLFGIAEKFFHQHFLSHRLTGLLLIADAVLHAGPEIHRHGAKLNFHRIVIHAVGMVNRHTKDNMVAAVAVGFRVSYVVSLLQDNQVFLLLNKIDNPVNVTDKVADHPDAGDIGQVIPGTGLRQLNH